MADRSHHNPALNGGHHHQHHQHPGQHHQSHSHPAPMSSIGQPRSGKNATLTNARRNLLQAQRARRPAHQAGGAHHHHHYAAAGGGEPAVHADHDPGPSSSSSSLSAGAGAGTSESLDLVVREANGDFSIDDPPAMELDEEEAAEAANDGQRERQRLSEAVKHHQINNSSVSDQPEELLEAVRASLRAKTAALTEDNWMYEAEEAPRG